MAVHWKPRKPGEKGPYRHLDTGTRTTFLLPSDPVTTRGKRRHAQKNPQKRAA